MSKNAISKLRNKFKGLMFAHGPRMITCGEFEDFIFDYLEDTLSPGKKAIFELHMKLCRECREFLVAYRASMELGIRKFEDDTARLPSEIPEDLVTAILAACEK